MSTNHTATQNKTTAIAGAPGFTVERVLTGYAYANNGNLANPTPRYVWNLRLDGRLVDRASTRSALVAEARENGDAYRTDRTAE